MIKQFRPPTRLAAWSGAGLCLCIGLATLTNAQETKSTGGDIVCDPLDIYGYTGTNGGTMIAAQLTNTGTQDVTVDVEFWEGSIDTGTKIGRGGLVVPAGKTATEALPWVVKNGSHIVSVHIDPESSVVESDETNNRVETTIGFTNGRFRPIATLSAVNGAQGGVKLGAAKRATLAPGQVLREGETWAVMDKNGEIVERPTALVNKTHVAGTDSGEDLKYLGLVLKMFSVESRGGIFPALSREPGRLMFGWAGDGHSYVDNTYMSVEFLTELAYVGCRNCNPSVDVPDDSRFAYLGYAVRSDEDVQRFAEAYEKWASEGGKGPWFADDKQRHADQGLVRLREAVGRFFITDITDPEAGIALAQSQIPTLIEWPEPNAEAPGKTGGNVLFVDGHVEYITYPGKWPMTEGTIGILCKLAGREPIKKLEP